MQPELPPVKAGLYVHAVLLRAAPAPAPSAGGVAGVVAAETRGGGDGGGRALAPAAAAAVHAEQPGPALRDGGAGGGLPRGHTRHARAAARPGTRPHLQ